MLPKTIQAYGFNYKLPTVKLLSKTPLYISEFAARTCYNSFDKSEHKEIEVLDSTIEEDFDEAILENLEENVNENGSKLLYDLSHVYFHESTLEHITLNFIIRNTSRGVLQELARHRIASFSVQSTRYTLNDLVNWLHISIKHKLGKEYFVSKMLESDILITTDKDLNTIEFETIYDKILLQIDKIGYNKFLELTVAKSLIEIFLNSENTPEDDFKLLSSKAKRNVGDAFKGIIVTDLFAVDLAFSINLRSLKNLIDLRLSGAAFHQFQWLATLIFNEVPESYRILVAKEQKIKQFEKSLEVLKSGRWN